MRYMDNAIAYRILAGLFRVPELQKVRWARAAKECLPEFYQALISYTQSHPDSTLEEIKSAFANVSEDTFHNKFDELVGAGYIQIATAGSELRYYSDQI